MENLYCLFFSSWKRNFIVKYFPSYHCLFINNVDCIDVNQKFSIVIWASKYNKINDGDKNKLSFYKSNSNCSNFILIEDGFIRSQGLGSDLYYPYSLVLDTVGIYYDPVNSNLLEKILFNIKHNRNYEELRIRAVNLIKTICDFNVAKYEQGKKTKVISIQKENYDKIIFVPCQVDDDQSLILGGCGFTNDKLLEIVRKNNPKSYIILKVHPDIYSGNRTSNLSLDYIKKFADFVCIDEFSSLDCISISDEIHTISSLTGFEALLRNKKVYCYGMPFYAGFGFTYDYSVEIANDIALIAKNRRTLIDIDFVDMVIGTLILYPTYYSWNNHSISEPEVIINELVKLKKSERVNLYYLGKRLYFYLKKLFK